MSEPWPRWIREGPEGITVSSTVDRSLRPWAVGLAFAAAGLAIPPLLWLGLSGLWVYLGCAVAFALTGAAVYRWTLGDAVLRVDDQVVECVVRVRGRVVSQTRWALADVRLAVRIPADHKGWRLRLVHRDGRTWEPPMPTRMRPEVVDALARRVEVLARAARPLPAPSASEVAARRELEAVRGRRGREEL